VPLPLQREARACGWTQAAGKDKSEKQIKTYQSVKSQICPRGETRNPFLLCHSRGASSFCLGTQELQRWKQARRAAHRPSDSTEVSYVYRAASAFSIPELLPSS